jgi:hypothetical protein
MIAGKYAQLMQAPVTAMTLGGGIAAGASLVGNQGEGKSVGRQALEALGAGALGAGVGRMLPTVSRIAAERAANQTKSVYQGLQTEGSRLRNVAENFYNKGLRPEEIESMIRAGIEGTQNATNTVAALGGLGLATGLGGLGGGGIANVGNMAGLPIDPEMPGSSNTMNSRLNMQGYA